MIQFNELKQHYIQDENIIFRQEEKRDMPYLEWFASQHQSLIHYFQFGILKDTRILLFFFFLRFHMYYKN